MPTAVPATKAAILEVLGARAGLAGVTLGWSGPTKDEDYVPEMVFLGEVERTSFWKQLGGHVREEEFSVAVTVYVEQFGDDPQTVEERAYALLDEVEDALRDDLVAPGGLLRAAGVFQFGEFRASAATGPASTEKWGARVDACVDFQARNV